MKQFLKFLSVFMVMVAMVNVNAFASSHSTHYGKVQVFSTGNGTVYIGTSNTAESGNAEETWNCNGNSGNDSKTYYLHATPDEGYKLDGWYTNEGCTEGKQTDNPYKLSVKAESTKSGSPTTSTWYAKFVDASLYFSSTMTVSCVGEGGTVAVSTESSNEDFGAEKSASNLKTENSAHTYYLQAKVSDADNYRFLGWYSDEACEKQLSKNVNYTYKVTAESTDEAAPTQFHAYAKFEAIPYYYSKVTATALGNGKVNVSLSNTAGEYDATSETSQKVADKAEHTYYLKAQVEDDETEFDGWFSDAECTEKLSDATAYTYKVTSTSLNQAEPTAVNAYAKFTARNMYQVRNAGFEKWVASNEVGYGWNSFQSATGSMAGIGKGMSPNPDKVEGRTGYAVKLISKYAGVGSMGANANGNLTTGIVNMGSMTPTDASNHNFTNVDDPDHSLIIVGQPDGVEFYTKYKMGDGEAHTGHAQFIIHDKYNYRDPETAEELEHKIAECGVNIEESEDWVRNTGDISYLWEKDEAEASEKYLLINFTTNVTPGGSKNDELIIDDVRLIYNSELATATIAGNEVVFTDGAATVNAKYDADALTLTSNGRAATIETSFNAATGVLTITVKGQDYEVNEENVHVYTIQYYAEAEMTIADDNGYATFVAPFAVAELPTGVKAYTVSAVKEDGTTLNLVEVTSIAANTPVVLQGANVSETYVDAFVKAVAVNGLLTGVYEDTAAPVGSYVLQNHDGVVGFYQVETEGIATVKANRAYLTLPEASEARVLTFGEETAINAINALTSGKAQIFDLNGRRLNSLQKGINIVNGVKILVK